MSRATTELQSGTNTRKPWGLHGLEDDIVRMRDVENRSFEEIAFRLGASKQGVIGAYQRGSQKQKEPAPSTGTAPVQDEAEAPTSTGSVAHVSASTTPKED